LLRPTTTVIYTQILLLYYIIIVKNSHYSIISRMCIDSIGHYKTRDPCGEPKTWCVNFRPAAALFKSKKKNVRQCICVHSAFFISNAIENKTSTPVRRRRCRYRYYCLKTFIFVFFFFGSGKRQRVSIILYTSYIHYLHACAI